MARYACQKKGRRRPAFAVRRTYRGSDWILIDVVIEPRIRPGIALRHNNITAEALAQTPSHLSQVLGS